MPIAHAGFRGTLWLWLIGGLSAAALSIFAGVVQAKKPDAVNQPPKGFVALFNGNDLSGWRGLGHFDPRKLAAMTPEQREKKQAADNENLGKHWRVEDGQIRGVHGRRVRRFLISTPGRRRG